MTPLEHYYQQIAAGGYEHNPQQEWVMRGFQRVYEEILAEKQELSPWLTRLKKWTVRTRKPIRGFYLWGSVGVGKTWLMDTFYQTLPAGSRLRMHFHQFMRWVQTELVQLQGQKDPLKLVAKHFAAQTNVICFDEFLVNDIADAMILANLLAALFAEGITLVTTANVEPDVLYRNGLQRSRFLPAITLIKEHLEVVNLPTIIDYRLQTHELSGTYFHPHNLIVEKHMQTTFDELSTGPIQFEQTLTINGRNIHAKRLAKNAVWFSFQDLCTVPRSQVDYLEIANLFPTVFLSDVPLIGADQDNSIRYLINLVDILYDKKIRLFISAAAPVTDIYKDGKMLFEFRRTRSRLLEMQSEEYLQKIKNELN